MSDRGKVLKQMTVVNDRFNQIKSRLMNSFPELDLQALKREADDLSDQAHELANLIASWAND